MNIEDLILYGKKHLHTHEVNMLLSHILGYDYLELSMHLKENVSTNDIDKFKKMVEEVCNNKPIQYVLGNVNFYGYEFNVNENVLIPRFETEELIENTIIYINKLFSTKNVKIIDLGCGSGNIGITLKKKLDDAEVTCVDISDNALNVAKENAEKLNADIRFIKSNMLDNINDKFDVIISNPPYVSKDEEVEDIVKNNEPHLALFADNDGLYFYDKILSSCKKNLSDKFLISFEIGMSQREKIISLINKYFCNVNVECKKDLSGKDRMIFIYKV